MVNVDFRFYSEDELEREKRDKLVRGYAGKLLQLCNARTLIIGVDNDDVPFVLSSAGRLADVFDLE